MFKKTALVVGLLLSLSGCAAAEANPEVEFAMEISRCGELAQDEVFGFYDTLAYLKGFYIKLENVKVSNLAFEDLGNSKGRVTGTYALTLESDSANSIDGDFVCSVDGASVMLEDWD